MRNSVKNLMALLIVFSVIAAKSADSAENATIFKVVAEKNDKVKLIYQAVNRQNVTV